MKVLPWPTEAKMDSDGNMTMEPIAKEIVHQGRITFSASKQRRMMLSGMGQDGRDE